LQVTHLVDTADSGVIADDVDIRRDAVLIGVVIGTCRGGLEADVVRREVAVELEVVIHDLFEDVSLHVTSSRSSGFSVLSRSFVTPFPLLLDLLGRALIAERVYQPVHPIVDCSRHDLSDHSHERDGK
jgi:hypothetical protein